MRRRPILGALLSFGVLLGVASVGSGGCAYDWSFPDEGTTPKEAGGPSDSPLGDRSIADAPSDAVVQDALEAGKPCKESLECAEEEYCKFADRHCGQTQAGGCTAIPKIACVADGYVCGCSGIVYKSECEAIKAGTDVSTTAACPSMAGTFRCGYRYCTTNKDWCLESKSGDSFDYKCVAFDASCSAIPDCTCPAIKNLTQCSCDQSNPGMVQVKCP